MMARWVEDPAFSLQWPRLLLCCGVNLWPRDFCMPQAWPKKSPPPQKKTLKKKPQPTPPKRKRVIDSENKQVVATWEVSGGRREIGEGD